MKSIRLHWIADAVGGSFWDMLTGLIFLNPLLGAAVVAGVGVLSGKLNNIGINDQFMKDLGETFKPGTSAHFVFVHKATTDKVLEHLSGFRGKVLKTSFTKDKEEELAHYFNSQVEPNISSSNTGRDLAGF